MNIDLKRYKNILKDKIILKWCKCPSCGSMLSWNVDFDLPYYYQCTFCDWNTLLFKNPKLKLLFYTFK